MCEKIVALSIGKLPAAKQRAIAQVLDAMLQQHGA